MALLPAPDSGPCQCPIIRTLAVSLFREGMSSIFFDSLWSVHFDNKKNMMRYRSKQLNIIA